MSAVAILCSTGMAIGIAADVARAAPNVPALLPHAEPPLDLRAELARPKSELADIVRGFEADEGNIGRLYPHEFTPERGERLSRLYDQWLSALGALDFDSLSLRAKADYVLLRSHIEHAQRQQRISADALAPAIALALQTPEVRRVAELRRRNDAMAGGDAALLLDQLRAHAEQATKDLDALLAKPAEDASRPTRETCKRLADLVGAQRSCVRDWYDFWHGYDPRFAWWCGQPFDAADRAMDALAKLASEKGVGITPENPDVIVGLPIGRDALLSELASEFIPYTPEELIAIGERELAWCRAQEQQAARDMGLGDDWRAALAKIKEGHVEPGEQPALVKQFAAESIAFVREHDLVTVPDLAEETWRMEMLSAESQKTSPFFLGGETIYVAFPTAEMDHEHKLMSLRGNNRHFARATVHHELFPGHGLQAFMGARSATHRGIFSTPFWTEGWSLHWEMLLWDQGFATTPEDRMGMLFWRSHRAARIIFSLKFHLGQMSAQQCVDYLVNEVGHERSNAEGEVRRSVSGAYGPLYQVGYMMGGMQLGALQKELTQTGVGGKKMSVREFHDAVLREGNMPIEVLRSILTQTPLTRDHAPSWKFDGP